MILPGLTTALFLVLAFWAIVVRGNVLITFIVLVFLIVNAAITLRSYRLWRKTSGVRRG